jgi:hypothetical protein
VIGLAPKGRVYEIWERLRDTRGGPDLREVARPEGKTAYAKTSCAIARDLNKDGVPTAQGAPAWSQATVRAQLTREGGTK